MVGEFHATVQIRATPKEVYDFLASGANTTMKVKSSDPNAMTVSLKSKIGFFSYGEIVDCSVKNWQNSCRVDLKGRPVLFANITADVKGTVMKVSDALIGRFRNR
ncbi:MAG TPA: hypothetical protein VMW02_01675 [Thermoplasmata archaeon]|nr:hypothetical protein [Thermoplasmata archaeon]